MTNTSRRSVLTGTAAVLAGGAAVNIAAITMAKAETVISDGRFPDPIFNLIEQYKALYDAIEAPGWNGEGLDDQVDKLNAIADDIRAAPIATAGGVAATLRWMVEYDLSAHEFEVDIEGAFLRRVADALDRMGALS